MGIGRASPEAVVTALERILLRDGIVDATHLRPDPPRFVHTGFLADGQAGRVVYDASLSWRERLDDAVAYITALADTTTVAFVQYATGTTYGLVALDTGSPPLPAGSREYHFREHPERLIDQVPDARGTMVLTDAHLARAHDLSGWSVTSLGSGRHLVQAADLAAWFAQPEVDPDVLAAAREAFGEMIWRRYS